MRHQLESYNDFVSNQIQKTIDMFNPVTVHSDQDYDKNSKKYRLELIITLPDPLLVILLPIMMESSPS